MVNLEKRQFLKMLGVLILGYFIQRTASSLIGERRSGEITGDGTARVKVEDGALVVE